MTQTSCILYFPSYWSSSTRNHGPLVKWSVESSADPEQWKAWSEKYPGCYYCIALTQSNMFVLDIDDKYDKNGSDSLEALIVNHGPLPKTKKVRTPSGGFHYFFKGAVAHTYGKIGKGIDTPVMVPMPGTDVPGKGKYEIIDDSPIADPPQWLLDLIGAPREKSENRSVPVTEEDQPANILDAVSIAMDAEPAVEGSGGDAATYRLACDLRDRALSPVTTLDIMLRYWNDRCSPPWTPEELEVKVNNAYNYAQSAPGERMASSDFQAIIDNPIESTPRFRSMRELCNNATRPEWLIYRYIEQLTTTLIYGESGDLKSFLAMHIGLSVACGLQWADNRVEQGTVFYLAGEGHGGIARRLRAFEIHNNLPKDADPPFYVSTSPIHLDNSENVAMLINEIKRMTEAHGAPKLIIIDTLATSFGSGDENSTRDMNIFLSNINQLKLSLVCSILIVHHTGHAVKDRPRGAYALMAGVDAHYRVERESRDSMFLRLCMAGKMKDGDPMPDTWFEARVIRIKVDEELNDVTSLALEHTPAYVPNVKPKHLGSNQQMIMDYLLSNNGQAAKSDLYKDLNGSIEGAGKPIHKQAINAALKSLADKNLIIDEGNRIKLPNSESTYTNTEGEL